MVSWKQSTKKPVIFYKVILLGFDFIRTRFCKSSPIIWKKNIWEPQSKEATLLDNQWSSNSNCYSLRLKAIKQAEVA